MMAIPAKHRSAQHRGDAVADCVGSHCPKALPCRRRMRDRDRGMTHVERGILRHHRISVDAPLFESDVLRPDVPFLEHVERHRERTGDFAGTLVHPAHLAEQDDRIDAVAVHIRGKPRWPGLLGTGVRDGTVTAEIRRVATVEVDLMDCPVVAIQEVGESAEERAHRALEKKRAPVLQQRPYRRGIVHCLGRPPLYRSTDGRGRTSGVRRQRGTQRSTRTRRSS